MDADAGEQDSGDKGRHLGDTTGQGGAAGATAAAGITATGRDAGGGRDVRAGRGIGAERDAGVGRTRLFRFWSTESSATAGEGDLLSASSDTPGGE